MRMQRGSTEQRFKSFSIKKGSFIKSSLPVYSYLSGLFTDTCSCERDMIVSLVGFLQRYCRITLSLS